MPYGGRGTKSVNTDSFIRHIPKKMPTYAVKPRDVSPIEVLAPEGSTKPSAATRRGMSPYHTTCGVSLMDRFIDESRPLHVAVIGGGLAGILAGILLPAKVPGLVLTIYEKNEDFVSEYVPR